MTGTFDAAVFDSLVFDTGVAVGFAARTLNLSFALTPGGFVVDAAIPAKSLGVFFDLLPGGFELSQTILGKTLSFDLALVQSGFAVSAEIAEKQFLVDFGITPTGFGLDVTLAFDPRVITVTGQPFALREVPVYDVRYEEWTVLKGTARRVVHDVFAVPAVIIPRDGSEPKAIRVRWHVRGNRMLGDLQGQGFGEVIAAVDRVVLNTEQLRVVGVTPQSGDKIVVSDLPGAEFFLDVRDPADGPVTQTWEVRRA